MKKSLLTFVFVLVVVIQGQAQFKDWGIKYGFRGSLLFPENEYANLGFSGNDNLKFDWFKISLMGDVFIGYELSRLFEIRLSGGYGFYSGKAVFAPDTDYGHYKSTIIPFLLKLKLSPFDMKSWNPYFFGGAGLMRYDQETTPDFAAAVSTKSGGWVMNIPAGIGAEFALTDGLLLDLQFGGAFSTTRDMDAYRSSTSKTWDSYLHSSIGLSFLLENCLTDDDNDELGKCDEEELGTNPDNADTDDDGLNDGEEYLSYKTDPKMNDTDLDGLLDGMEVQTSLTNPLSSDTDNDKLSDGEEYTKHRTNPLLADTDKDGLDDNYEITVSRSNPLLADTDKDKLTDAEEVKNYMTNPLKDDTDGDGLTDSEEILKYMTDPLNWDTDRGTVNDLVEIVRGSDPLNAEDDITIEVGASIVFEGITFEVNKAEITPESEKILMKALKTMQVHSGISVEIIGHTDNVGSSNANKKLSESRALAVKQWLINKGIPGERITASGYGEDFPRVPNNTHENKRLNRRIEFKRIK